MVVAGAVLPACISCGQYWCVHQLYYGLPPGACGWGLLCSSSSTATTAAKACMLSGTVFLLLLRVGVCPRGQPEGVGGLQRGVGVTPCSPSRCM